MIYVADVLAENLSSDYEVFQNFANLVHGTHLINFYTNDNIVEFAQNYLTNALKRQIPKLLTQTENQKYLQRIFCDAWSTVFAKVLPEDIRSRFFDLWLLEGEKILFQAIIVIGKMLADDGDGFYTDQKVTKDQFSIVKFLDESFLDSIELYDSIGRDYACDMEDYKKSTNSLFM